MQPYPPRRRAAAVLIGLMLLALLTVDAYSNAPSTLRVTFLDVGQGDAAWLRDSNGFDVLIDGGEKSEGAGLVDSLRAGGLGAGDELEVLVATHYHDDHIGGLVSVLQARDIPIGRVLYNGYPGTTSTWLAFLSAAADRGLTPEAAQFPGEFDWGEMRVYVLNPAGGPASADANDDSLVLRVDHGQVRFLFTGDMTSRMEPFVLARATPVAAQVLKVAHHGSSDSSGTAFLAAVGAQEAVISVGEDNQNGHPHPETLQRLAAAGSRTWRTDWNGSVFVASDGVVFTVDGSTERYWTFLPLLQNSQPAPVLPQVAIVDIFYDGTVSSSEPDEYVALQNQGSAAIALNSWTLRDNSGTIFTFPSFSLQPGQVCRVYTHQDHPEWCGFSYERGSAIWNNSGDCATLRDAVGQEVDQFCYYGVRGATAPRTP